MKTYYMLVIELSEQENKLAAISREPIKVEAKPIEPLENGEHRAMTFIDEDNKRLSYTYFMYKQDAIMYRIGIDVGMNIALYKHGKHLVNVPGENQN